MTNSNSVTNSLKMLLIFFFLKENGGKNQNRYSKKLGLLHIHIHTHIYHGVINIRILDQIEILKRNLFSEV
jgi:hypothetical protein